MSRIEHADWTGCLCLGFLRLWPHGSLGQSRPGQTLTDPSCWLEKGPKGMDGGQLGLHANAGKLNGLDNRQVTAG